MKIVTIYVAFDDVKFYTMEECIKYENKAMQLLIEIFDAYDFYDENHEKYYVPYIHNVEEGLDFLDWVTDRVAYIDYKKVLSDDAWNFIYIHIGEIMPNQDEVGRYRYDYSEYEWVKT